MAEEQRHPLASTSTDMEHIPLSIPPRNISGINLKQRLSRDPSYSSVGQFGEEETSYRESSKQASTNQLFTYDGHTERIGLGNSGTACKNGPRRKGVLLNWWQEIGACILAVAAILALFATLYFYADKPSPDWPEWISLNTIVAIYVVLLKTGILLVAAEGLSQLKWNWISEHRALKDLVTFDDASRGPWGALQLLWNIKLRYLLASLGAMIIVLSLATDPFAQQILHYIDCAISVDRHVSSVPRSNFYSQLGGGHVAAGISNIGPGLQNSINAGIFAPTRSPTAACPTGNCTVPHAYSAVGFCSECNDISDHLIFNNHTYNLRNSYDNRTSHTFNLTTSLPWGLASDSTPGEGYQPLQSYAAFGAPYLTGTTAVDFILGKNFQGAIDPSTGSKFPQCTNAAANQSWQCRGYGASRCQIYPCVKTYNGSINTGVLSEHLIDTSTNWGYSPDVLALTMLDTECINIDEREAVTKQGYSIGPNERWLPYHNVTTSLISNITNHTFPDSMVSRDCIYGLDQITLNSLNNYFIDYFHGNITGYMVVPGGVYGVFFGEQSLRAIFNFGDVDFARMDETFTNITDSLTNFMRQNSAPGTSSTPALAIAMQNKTCIAVRWPWLAFPAALVLLTLLFFALMITETRPGASRPAIWKSSPLALLYHGLQRSEGGSLDLRGEGNVHDVEGMQRFARTVTVKLSSPTDSVAKLEVKEM